MNHSLSRWLRGIRLPLAFGLLVALAAPGIAQEKPEEARAYLTSPISGVLFVEKALSLEAVTVDGTDLPVSHVEFLSGDTVVAAAKRSPDQPPTATPTKILFKATWERPALGIQILQVRALSGDTVVALSERVRVLLVGIPQPPPPPPEPTVRVAIVTPEPGAKAPIDEPLEITAKVSATEPIEVVSFYAMVNGQTEEIGSLRQEPWQITWKPRTPGLALLYAKAGTRSGSAKSEAIPVMLIGVLPPLPPVASIKVSLLSPKPGEILKPGASVQIAAETGGTEPVDSVTFVVLVDGDRKEIGTDSEAPWEVSWVVPEARSGILMAEARSKTAKAMSIPVPVRIQSASAPRDPLVWLKPHDDLTWIAGVPLPLVVQVDETGGSFKSVEFFDGDISLGDGKRLPSGDLGIAVPSLFVLDWTGKAGPHVLSAMGHRVDGSSIRVDGPTLMVKDPTEPPRPAWVRITTPNTGGFVNTPEISLQAVVFETAESPISAVEFVIDASVVAIANRPADAPASSPEQKLIFEARWTQPVSGMHVLHARAISGETAIAKSEPVRFVVGEAKPPLPPEIAPKVLIASPQNGDRIPAGQPLEIMVKPNTTEPILSVEFLAITGGELKELGTVSQEPWTFTWQEPTEGLSLLLVRARIGSETVRSFPTLVVIGDAIVWSREDIKIPGAGGIPGLVSSDPGQPRIAPLKPSREGRHELVMVGGDDGTPMDLEASDDLVRWTRVARGVLSLGSTMDVNATNESKKGLFYRLVPAAP